MTMFLYGPEQDALEKMLQRRINPVPAPVINQYGLEPSASRRARYTAEASNRVNTPNDQNVTPLEALRAGYGKGQPPDQIARDAVRRNGESDTQYTARLQTGGYPNDMIGDAMAANPLRRPSTWRAITTLNNRELIDPNKPYSQSNLRQKTNGAPTGPYVQPGVGFTGNEQDATQRVPTQASRLAALDTPAKVNFTSDNVMDPAFAGGADATGQPLAPGQVFQTADGLHFRNDPTQKTPMLWDAGSGSHGAWQPRDTVLAKMAKVDFAHIGKAWNKIRDDEAAIRANPAYKGRADLVQEHLKSANIEGRKNDLAKGIPGPDMGQAEQTPKTIEDIGGFRTPDGAVVLPNGKGGYDYHAPPKPATSAAPKPVDPIKAQKDKITLRKTAADAIRAQRGVNEDMGPVSDKEIDQYLKDHSDEGGAAGGKDAAPVPFATDDEFAKIPSGTLVQDPEGGTWVKP